MLDVVVAICGLKSFCPEMTYHEGKSLHPLICSFFNNMWLPDFLSLQDIMGDLTICLMTTAPCQRKTKKEVSWSSMIPSTSTERRTKRAKRARRRKTRRKSGVTSSNVWRKTTAIAIVFLFFYNHLKHIMYSIFLCLWFVPQPMAAQTGVRTP